MLRLGCGYLWWPLNIEILSIGFTITSGDVSILMVPFCVKWCVCVCVRACVHVLSATQLVRLFAILGICSPPGSSVDGISQARILEWVAITPSGDLPDPGIKPMSPASPALAGRFFTTEPPRKSCVKWSFINISKRHLGTWYSTSAAAAAAKSLQSCPTLCNPIDSSPPGSPIPGILQASTLEWVAITFSPAWKWKVKVKSLSPVRLLATPWTAAHQAPPSMGFSRQEYWSGVPLPSLDRVLQSSLNYR